VDEILTQIEKTSSSQNKIKILFTLSDDLRISGCAWYRVWLPAVNLSIFFKDECEITCSDFVISKDETQYDIFYFTRQVKEDVVNFVEQMKEKNKNKFIILDMDDNLLNIPSHIESAKKYYDGNKHNLFRIMKCADLFTFTQEHLAKTIMYYTGIYKPYILLPNAVNTSKLQRSHPEFEGTIVIGWFGSWTHIKDFMIIKGLIEDVYSKIKDKMQIKLITIGIPKNLMLVHFFKAEPEFEWINIDWLPPPNYLETICSLGIHIGIAPLLDTEFNKCKSNIKLLEYVLAGAVFLASDVYPYSETLTKFKQYTHAKNRYYDWYRKLYKLIIDHELRKNIHNDLKKELAEKYSCENVYQKFGKELIDFYKKWRESG